MKRLAVLVLNCTLPATGMGQANPNAIGDQTATSGPSSRAAQAVSYFKEFCLGTAGDLRASIDALSSSDVFRDTRISETKSLTLASFEGPNHINASVKLGFSSYRDHCTIAMFGADDPLATSQSLASALAGDDQSEITFKEPFGDYSQGGYMIPYGSGEIVVSPLPLGASSIVHINFFLETK